MGNTIINFTIGYILHGYWCKKERKKRRKQMVTGVRSLLIIFVHSKTWKTVSVTSTFKMNLNYLNVYICIF